MKIVFWSEEEKIGTTFNLAAVACTAALLYPISAAVVSGGYQDGDLEQHFSWQKARGTRNFLEEQWSEQIAAEKEEYFISGGMDFLLGKKEPELSEALIKNNMRQIIPERLYCLPCGKRQYEEWWNKGRLFEKMEKVAKAVEKCFDLLFVDCGARKNDFSRKMLQEADVCILNMSQESEQIGDYYRLRPRLPGKIFFLVGKYFEEELYNKDNLIRMYRIEEERLGAVPYNAQLQAAGMAGKTGGFMSCNLKYGAEGGGLHFEKELIRTTKLILKLAGLIS